MWTGSMFLLIYISYLLRYPITQENFSNTVQLLLRQRCSYQLNLTHNNGLTLLNNCASSPSYDLML
jgi:hypothetical protein